MTGRLSQSIVLCGLMALVAGCDRTTTDQSSSSESGGGVAKMASGADLANALKQAIESKNVNQAAQLVAWGQAPAAAYRLFKMGVADCFEPPYCTVALGEMSAEDSAPQEDYFFPHPPEGQVTVASGDGSGSMSFPFAKVDGNVRFVLGNVTPKGAAAAKAEANSERIAKELEPEVVSAGTQLPADGGEPAKAYAEYLAAIHRKDAKFLATSGSEIERFLFSDMYLEKPVKSAIALDVLSLENLKDFEVDGGFTKDNKAVLMVRGTTGNGWPAAGAAVLEKQESGWRMASQYVASYPPEG